MRKTAHLFILSLILVPVVRASGSESKKGATMPASQDSSENTVPGQLLIRFKDGVTEDSAKAILAKHSLKFLQKLGSMNLYLAETPAGKDLSSVQAELKAEESIKYSEPNSVMRTMKTK
jgi:hypothetical protein